MRSRRLDPRLVGLVLDAFIGRGNHLVNAKSGRPVWQLEFAVPDAGVLTNARGLYERLHERYHELVPRLTPWGHDVVYRVLEAYGIKNDRPLGTRPGERAGATEPQVASERALGPVDPVRARVTLRPPPTTRRTARVASSGRVVGEYEGIRADGRLWFCVAGELLDEDAYLALTGLARASVRRALAHRLPVGYLAR